MNERKSKINVCGGYMITDSGGWYFRLDGPSCMIGTMRTVAARSCFLELLFDG